MGNTYTQIHIQTVFAVSRRQCVIDSSWEEELYRYISVIIERNDHKVLAVNGVNDHVHILFGMRPKQSLSDLMQDVKGDTSKWINKRGFLRERFSWQEGFGAFSYSKEDVNYVIDYIKNQKEHHLKQRFLQEYLRLLKENCVDFDERYLFEEI